MKKYDVIVIGSGGGSKISTPANRLGYKVALIEKWKLGGTCLNRGCIPSKMLIHPANVAISIKESKKFDINLKGKVSVNFSKLIKRISDTVDEESAAIVRGHKQNKTLDFYPHEAKFISDKALLVNNKKITAKKIFIAAGARSNIPPIEGLKDVPYMTSTEALRNRKLPKKLIVIGGGYIACELGHAYSALGSDVHFIVRKGRFLMREDKQVSETFSKVFKKSHTVHIGYTPTKVSYKNKQFIVVMKRKNGKIKKIKGDGLLVATGVKPNSDNLGLENTKIKTNKRGFIKVNKYMETPVKGVYALGDIIGKYMFRHSVNFEGEFLLKTLFVEKKRKPIKYPPMPYAVFTHPEIGAVGPTEEQLKEKNVKYVVGFNPYKASAQGMARLSENDFAKLIFDKKTKKLISARIIGEEAATMIHQLIYAMTLGATVDNLLEMIYIHPALPEIVRNAARKAKAEF
jgi:dihydrolipoamide dehydrogenase